MNLRKLMDKMIGDLSRGIGPEVEEQLAQELKECLTDHFLALDILHNFTFILLRGTQLALEEIVNPTKPFDHEIRQGLDKLVEFAKTDTISPERL